MALTKISAAEFHTRTSPCQLALPRYCNGACQALRTCRQAEQTENVCPTERSVIHLSRGSPTADPRADGIGCTLSLRRSPPPHK